MPLPVTCLTHLAALRVNSTLRAAKPIGETHRSYRYCPGRGELSASSMASCTMDMI